MKYFTIIPAAGVGARMNADRPKQYLSMHNEPLLQRVANTFSSITAIEKVVIVLHAKDHWWPTLNLKHPEKIVTVIGGKERVHSVLLGLECLKDFAQPDDFMLVHDAARPFITEENIINLMTELKDHPVGGLLGLPVVDTLKKVDAHDTIEKTMSREGLWQAQTPQCFRYGLLKSSIEKALRDHQIVTDESSALEYAGYHPKMILGDSRNRKITFVEDLFLV